MDKYKFAYKVIKLALDEEKEKDEEQTEVVEQISKDHSRLGNTIQGLEEKLDEEVKSKLRKIYNRMDKFNGKADELKKKYSCKAEEIKEEVNGRKELSQEDISDLKEKQGKIIRRLDEIKKNQEYLRENQEGVIEEAEDILKKDKIDKIMSAVDKIGNEMEKWKGEIKRLKLKQEGVIEKEVEEEPKKEEEEEKSKLPKEVQCKHCGNKYDKRGFSRHLHDKHDVPFSEDIEDHIGEPEEELEKEEREPEEVGKKEPEEEIAYTDVVEEDVKELLSTDEFKTKKQMAAEIKNVDPEDIDTANDGAYVKVSEVIRGYEDKGLLKTKKKGRAWAYRKKTREERKFKLENDPKKTGVYVCTICGERKKNRDEAKRHKSKTGHDKWRSGLKLPKGWHR